MELQPPQTIGIASASVGGDFAGIALARLFEFIEAGQVDEFEEYARGLTADELRYALIQTILHIAAVRVEVIE